MYLEPIFLSFLNVCVISFWIKLFHCFIVSIFHEGRLWIEVIWICKAFSRDYSIQSLVFPKSDCFQTQDISEPEHCTDQCTCHFMSEHATIKSSSKLSAHASTHIINYLRRVWTYIAACGYRNERSFMCRDYYSSDLPLIFY